MDLDIFGEKVRKEEVDHGTKLRVVNEQRAYLDKIDSDLAYSVGTACDVLDDEALARRVRQLSSAAQAEYAIVNAMSVVDFLKYRAGQAL